MKSIITLILILFSATLFAQKSVNPLLILSNKKANSDTLIVPVGKYKFIKVGDKVYKIQSSLEEVKEEQGWWNGITTVDTANIWRNPIYLPNRTF